MIGNHRQHMTKVRFGVDTVKLGRAQQAVHGGRAFAARVRPQKQVVLATQANAT